MLSVCLSVCLSSSDFIKFSSSLQRVIFGETNGGCEVGSFVDGVVQRYNEAFIN